LKSEEWQNKGNGGEGVGFSPYQWQCYGIADQQYPDHIPGNPGKIEFLHEIPQHLVQEKDTVGDDEKEEPLLNGQSEEVKIFGVVVVEPPDARPGEKDIPDNEGDRGKDDPREDKFHFAVHGNPLLETLGQQLEDREAQQQKM